MDVQWVATWKEIEAICLFLFCNITRQCLVGNSRFNILGASLKGTPIQSMPRMVDHNRSLIYYQSTSLHHRPIGWSYHTNIILNFYIYVDPLRPFASHFPHIFSHRSIASTILTSCASSVPYGNERPYMSQSDSGLVRLGPSDREDSNLEADHEI